MKFANASIQSQLGGAMTLAMKYGIICLFILLNDASALWSEFEIRTIESLNGTTGQPFIFKVRQKRIEKGVYGMSGTIEMTDDLSNYDCVVIIFTSSSGNNDFKQSPLNIPGGKACEKADGEYRKYLMKNVHDYSDLPYTEDPDESICDMFAKGKKFTLNGYQVDSSMVTKFLPAGVYKLQVTLKVGEVVMSGVEMVIELS